MRLNLLILVLAVLTVFYTGEAMAGANHNDTVSVVEYDRLVVFSGTVEFTTDSKEDNEFSRVIAGEFLDWENAVLRVYGNAESNIDVNLFIQGGPSTDSTLFSEVYTQTAFDGLGAATVTAWYAMKDTINQAPSAGGDINYFVDPVAYEPFKRLKADGQSSNPAAARIYWYLTVPKLPGAPHRNAYGIFDAN